MPTGLASCTASCAPGTPTQQTCVCLDNVRACARARVDCCVCCVVLCAPRGRSSMSAAVGSAAGSSTDVQVDLEEPLIATDDLFEKQGHGLHRCAAVCVQETGVCAVCVHVCMCACAHASARREPGLGSTRCVSCLPRPASARPPMAAHATHPPTHAAHTPPSTNHPLRHRRPQVLLAADDHRAAVAAAGLGPVALPLQLCTPGWVAAAAVVAPTAASASRAVVACCTPPAAVRISAPACTDARVRLAPRTRSCIRPPAPPPPPPCLSQAGCQRWWSHLAWQS
jgi:hypothetical protein